MASPRPLAPGIRRAYTDVARPRGGSAGTCALGNMRNVGQDAPYGARPGSLELTIRDFSEKGKLDEPLGYVVISWATCARLCDIL